jgi:sirohydrochlorin cobaltochelatase
VNRGIVLMGHGTRDLEGTAEFLGYADALRARTGEPVIPGVLEFPCPDLPDIQAAFDQAAASGLEEIVALPALLFFAGHTQDDMPGETARAQKRHAGLRIALAGPLGSDERLLSAVEDRLRPFALDEDSAVLLVGRGSLYSDANADLFKTARMLWDRNRYGWVEAAFVSLAPPDVATGVERCRRLGARRVVVIPYFLNTGVLVKRIGRQALAAGAEVAPHLGGHELVVEVLLDRLGQARAGECPCRAASGCRVPGWSRARGAECLQPA